MELAITPDSQVSNDNVSDANPPRDLLAASYLREILRGAVKEGFDPLELLDKAGIDRRTYDTPSASIDGEQFQALILATSRAMDDEHLGFLGVKSKLAMGRLVGDQGVQSATLGMAIAKMAKIINAVRSDLKITLASDHQDGNITVNYAVTHFQREVNPHFFYEFKLFWMYKFLCWLIGERIELRNVAFSSPASPFGSDAKVLFKVPISYNQNYNGITFSTKVLNNPIVRARPELREGAFFGSHSNWLSIPSQDQPFARRIERMLHDIYHEGYTVPTLEILAHRLNCSARTISRKLAKEDCSFQQLKDRVRQTISESLLLDTELTIAEVAEKVGFAEPSDFTRAYVSWTGIPPSEYRRRGRLEIVGIQAN